jgi:hypothetical protein
MTLPADPPLRMSSIADQVHIPDLADFFECAFLLWLNVDGLDDFDVVFENMLLGRRTPAEFRELWLQLADKVLSVTREPS